jgi:hypothetical protein
MYHTATDVDVVSIEDTILEDKCMIQSKNANDTEQKPDYTIESKSDYNTERLRVQARNLHSQMLQLQLQMAPQLLQRVLALL